MEIVRDFILGGSKITTDGDCSCEIKRCLLLGRNVMTNIDSMLKRKDCFANLDPSSQSYVLFFLFFFFFPVVLYGYESWTINKAEP